MEGGRVVCGCFKHEDNPDLPDVILPGTRSDIQAEAAEFCKGYSVPTFVKIRENQWCHVGNYHVVRVSTDAAEIALQQVRSFRKSKGRDKISQVLYLDPVGEYFDLKTMTRVERNAACQPLTDGRVFT